MYMHKAFAGIYFEGESDNSDQSPVFAAAQSEGSLYAAIFMGQLRYTYQKDGREISVISNLFTPTVGYNWAGPITFSLAFGYTREDKQENGEISSKASTGAFAQMGAWYRRKNYSAEFLLSYTANTKLIRNRVRIKQNMAGRYSLGSEVYFMGNEDFYAHGIGLLAEKKWPGFSYTFKAGMNTTSTIDHGIYGGLEFYVPFKRRVKKHG